MASKYQELGNLEVFAFEKAPTSPRGTHKGPLDYGCLGPKPPIGEVDDDEGDWWNINGWIPRAQYLRFGPVVLRHGTQALYNYALAIVLVVMAVLSVEIDWVLLPVKIIFLAGHGWMWAGERPYGRTPDKLALVKAVPVILAKLAIPIIIFGRATQWFAVAGIVLLTLVAIATPFLVGSLAEFLVQSATCAAIWYQADVMSHKAWVFLVLAVLGTFINFACKVAYVFTGAHYGWYAQKERQDGIEKGPFFGYHSGDDVGDAMFHFAVF